MCVMLGADSSNYRLNTSGKKICKLFDKGSSLNFLVESCARKSPGCPRFFFGLFGKVRQKDFRVRFEIRLLTLSLNTAQHSLTLPNLFGTNLFDLPRSRQQTFFTFSKQFVTFFFVFSFFFPFLSVSAHNLNHPEIVLGGEALKLRNTSSLCAHILDLVIVTQTQVCKARRKLLKFKPWFFF